MTLSASAHMIPGVHDHVGLWPDSLIASDGGQAKLAVCLKLCRDSVCVLEWQYIVVAVTGFSFACHLIRGCEVSLTRPSCGSSNGSYCCRVLWNLSKRGCLPYKDLCVCSHYPLSLTRNRLANVSSASMEAMSFVFFFFFFFFAMILL